MIAICAVGKSDVFSVMRTIEITQNTRTKMDGLHERIK